jgi:hypothetical protein
MVKQGRSMDKITLESGREVNYEKPNFRTRAKLWDRVAKAYKDGFLGLEDSMEVFLACKAGTEEDLDQDKFSTTDIYNISSEILKQLFATELTKKK